MAFSFPKGVHTDVRVEEVYKTQIRLRQGELEECKETKYSAAFIRMYDGIRWLYASVANLESIQRQIDELYTLSRVNPDIDENPVVKKMEAHQEKRVYFLDEKDVEKIGLRRKLDLLKEYDKLLEGKEYLLMKQSHYLDERVVKSFFSSLGSDIQFDTQRVGLSIQFSLGKEEKRFQESFERSGSLFTDMEKIEEKILFRYNQASHFLLRSQPVIPGTYTMVLSPDVSGIFAHESIGHRSEADFATEHHHTDDHWPIGKKIGSHLLTVVDSGLVPGYGFAPFDDEGTPSRPTELIKSGILSGRLHSATTAAKMGEEVTGNARALDFQFEPIVRMTTTYVKEGTQTLYDLISDIDNGLLVETLRGGAGMNRFSLIPSLAYRICKGTVAQPIRASVITGHVFDALNHIEGVSDKVTLSSIVMGGCGKMGQKPLPISFGGPYLRVRGLNVQ